LTAKWYQVPLHPQDGNVFAFALFEAAPKGGEEMFGNWLKKTNSQVFYCYGGMATGYATVRRMEVIE
jgi:hypothetical protein